MGYQRAEGPVVGASVRRRLPVGAEIVPGGVHFRVWAPAARRATVVTAHGEIELRAEADGYFALFVSDLPADALYRFRFDDDELRSDPASRFQPDGPLGPSRVVDPTSFTWTDSDWQGPTREGQVLYEMHIGTFTPEGTYRAAMERLPDLVDVGITLLEVMPLHDFGGSFGWGYDGVCLFAPTRLYGEPDDLRAFVDRAHALGLGVILDVVYNHLGPVGNFIPTYAPTAFSDRHSTDWGKPWNFDGPGCGPPRAFILANAVYWITEFHLDGFRIDATQAIFDDAVGHRHILTEMTEACRTAAAPRSIYIVGENEPQQAQLLKMPEAGGMGLDALWNDDFHHTARVALTGSTQAYYTDYRGTPQELISALKWGFLFQGQRYDWQDKPRGSSTRGLGPERFVLFLQNHDQIANSGRGCRVHEMTSPGRWRALTALMLLGPCTPMLFQGQEWQCSSPFYYFADFEGELADATDDGRRKELSQFPNLATAEAQAHMQRPDALSTFTACKLDWAERERNQEALAFHRDLLRLRREDPVLHQGATPYDGAVLSSHAFLLRWLDPNGQDRLLLVNLGVQQRLSPAPEPLLAPPGGHLWQVLWSSEDPSYGGSGTAAVYRPEKGWLLPGESAVLLTPVPDHRYA